ncbi:MAG: VWA domain-containing protein, partial [Clostridiales bacterium]|nr:VWA domain-containing protein [Clostridiales bacterium]
GAIKVSSEHVSNIEARPMGESNLSITHPEFDSEDIYLDRTPDGDFIVFVPAGYWNVKIYPEGNSLVNNYETLMVPVHSGEMTVIDVPYSISNSLKSSRNDYDERGVRIGKITENAQLNQASVMFTLLDNSTKDILPDIENTVLAEGGQPVKIVDIHRVETPPSVVLLLDSSGSMSGHMEETLTAARSFIEGLPDDTKIEIVDFDDKPEHLTGTTKSEALANLSKIKVNGNTALYESIKMGIELLDGEDRPSLVVFTDGENDYRFDGGINFEDTLALVKNSGMPLFTIGFGQGHDARTLQNLAKVPGGKYFSAEDGEALEQVFAAINERLGSTFEALYERPEEASVGDIPVVSFVIDTSGSMYDTVEDFGCRIFNVKELIREFFLGLPEEVQMQLTEFDEDIKIVQTMTTDKLKILRGVGRLEARGGTEIVGSVEASYKTLKEVPSTKKVLIYITDAALGTSDEDNEYLREIMSDMKNDDISVLWVGMGINERDAEDFALAAELSGGEYIISEDANLLNEKFNLVLKDVVEKPSTELSNVFLGVEKVTETGVREYYSTSILADLSPVKKSDSIISSETINYTTGKLTKQYDAYTAANISGDSRPVEDTIIKKRMEADVSGSSEAVKITVNELIFYG